MLKILRPGRAADVPAGRDQDRPRHRQRHRHPRRAGLAPPRDAGADARRHRDPRQPQHQRHVRQRCARRSAVLHDGDIVTIGNVDLVFRGGTLVRRTETEAATRTGGLEVHGVTWTIEGNKTLLDNISLAARPGTLTAVIGPSGAGKSTFARLVAGYTHPTTGTVSFEGHDVHAEYASLRSRIGMVPQDDVVHGQLTVSQALMYAAELRLPPDTNKEDREQVVDAGARGTRDDPAPRHPRRQALRRAAQARIGGAGAADRPVAADPRRADLGSGPRAGPPGDDDAAPARRRRPRGAGGHALADLPRRVRPGAAAGARRQDRVLRAAQPDRPVDGHHQLGRHLQLRRAATPTRPTSGSSPQHGPPPPQPAAQKPADLGEPDARPACGGSSRRSRDARCG